MRSLTLLFTLCAAAFCAAKPNILFILADDLGKEWIGCYGAQDIETPHIDALASGGMKFHNAYSMPQCTPSRVALLTGTYPWRNGWVNHWDVPRWGVGYFDAKQKRNTAVARLLKDAGYATSTAGKRHRDHPMFLYHAMCLPHAPFVTTPDEPGPKTHLERHKAMVRYLDKQVGRLVAAIDELGLRERTIVIFTTDNGSTNGIAGTRNGRKVEGAKADKIEAGVNAPFIVNAPGLVPAGVETDALTDFTDLLPTFVDLAGSRLPDGLETDGVSLAPHLLGKAGDSGREWIMALGHGPARLDAKGVRGVHDFAPRVIRDKRFKVWVNSSKTIDRLHDLKADPWETTNLLDGGLNAEQQAALRKFQEVVDRLPDRDARPLYEPRTPNPWDQKLHGDGIPK